MTVTVFTKPNCPQCTMTKLAMDKHGIEYELTDVQEDGEALLTIKEMGYLQVPVVLAGEDHWSGFNPDKIAALSS